MTAFVLDKRIEAADEGYVIRLSQEELAAMGLAPSDDVEVHLERKGGIVWDRIPADPMQH